MDSTKYSEGHYMIYEVFVYNPDDTDRLCGVNFIIEEEYLLQFVSVSIRSGRIVTITGIAQE